MPRPVYIVVADSGTEDKLTGLVSHFNVLEKISFTKDQSAAATNRMVLSVGLRFRAVAVWMQLNDDAPNTEYEFQMGFVKPSETDFESVHSGSFSFAPGRPFYRMTLMAQGDFFGASGILLIRSRIREAGTEQDWIVQDYPILVEEIKPNAEPKDSANQSKS